MTPIAIVGSGPTALYALKALLTCSAPLAITLFEKTGTAGTGSPYRRQTNGSELLANIASIELPPLLETLEDWLKSRSSSGLVDLGISADDISDRTFFPRVAIGTYYRDQLFRMAERATAIGHSVDIRVHHVVDDIVPIAGGGATVCGHTEDGTRFATDAEHVVVATGHSVEEDAAPTGTYFDSPYPTSRLANIPARRVAVLGTSLSAIDTVMTVALSHGAFHVRDGALRYDLSSGAEGLQMTMISRSGILPEADFFCPIPYLPLSIFTEAAVAAVIEAGNAGLLDRTMILFARQLMQSDPVYAASVAPALDDADAFPQAYFAPRERSDAFEWARLNLDEVRANKDAERVIEWRYAILRMHEVFEAVVEHLDAQDRRRFDAGMKKVFVDNYAAIPPLSVERLLALRDAGVLGMLRLGDDYGIDSDHRGHHLKSDDVTRTYDVLVDATGQASSNPSLPFPSLTSQDDGTIAALPGFHLAALPFLLKERPFIQGLVSCEEVGREVAATIVAMVTSHAHVIDRAA